MTASEAESLHTDAVARTGCRGTVVVRGTPGTVDVGASGVVASANRTELHGAVWMQFISRRVCDCAPVIVGVHREHLLAEYIRIASIWDGTPGEGVDVALARCYIAHGRPVACSSARQTRRRSSLAEIVDACFRAVAIYKIDALVLVVTGARFTGADVIVALARPNSVDTGANILRSSRYCALFNISGTGTGQALDPATWPSSAATRTDVAFYQRVSGAVSIRPPDTCDSARSKIILTVAERQRSSAIVQRYSSISVITKRRDSGASALRIDYAIGGGVAGKVMLTETMSLWSDPNLCIQDTREE